MRNANGTIRFRNRRGFTLIEAIIVSVLMAFLAVLISTTWSAFIRPIADIGIRCRIAQEANLAVASLTRDLAGNWTDDPTGTQSKYAVVGRLQPGNTQLRLDFDGGTTPDGVANWASPDYVVSYYMDDNKLIRWDENTGATFVVARYVDSFEVTDLGNDEYQIDITFSFRGTTLSYTLVGRDP